MDDYRVASLIKIANDVLWGGVSLSNQRAVALKRYQQWNSAIYVTLFGEPRSQAPSYLYLEPELLAQAAAIVPGAPADPRSSLIDAVRGSLGWDKVDTPFLWHIGEAYGWVEDGMKDCPPFLALLAVLVLGAEAMVGDGTHAAHNYYDRLVDLLGVDSSLETRIRRDFKDTIDFWQILNDWLVQWDGEMGLPSAQITDRRVNIGYPISQALVSGQDRRRLATAFEDYGLRPGRRMAPLEMDQYLAHWLSHSSAPPKLRRLWAQDEARRRITLVACAELQAWAGPAAQVEAQRSAGRIPLLWRADLSRGAMPAIDLLLACQADPSRVTGRYSIIDPTDQTGQEGLSGAAAVLAIEQMRGSDLNVLEPWNQISLAALLGGAFTLERIDGHPVKVSRSSNPILVLTYDDRDALWHEVTRAQLLERCIVIVHADALIKVEDHLKRYARSGYERHDARSLEGLPAAWTAFLDVILADAPANEAPGVLAALSPTRADVVLLEGGLRLGRQTWHPDAPPEISATLVIERNLRLTVERRRELEPGPETLRVAEGLGRASASLAGLGLTSGDYLVSLKAASREGAQLLDESNFRLRTASFPRPIRVENNARLGYALGSASGLVSATLADGPAPTVVRGGQISGEPGALFPDPVLRLSTNLAPAVAPPPPSTAKRIVEAPTYAMPCAVRAHHYWIVDAARPDDDWQTLKHMQCRDCQREEWRRSSVRRRGASPARRSTHHQREAERPRSRLPGVRHAPWGRPTLDLMLDALSYIGAGSWAGFREMAQSLEPDAPYLAAEAARAFSALGHLDLTLDPRTQKPASWRIAPATLVETCDGSWVLAGARSDCLVEAILSANEVSASCEGEGLVVVRVPAASADGIDALVDRLRTAGQPLALSARFSDRLAGQLPALAGLPQSAEAFRLGSDDVERFDLESRQWSDAGKVRGAGAYRVVHHGRLHGVASDGDDAGVIRIVDPLSAKHLAATTGGGSLIAYNQVQQILVVPLGAELPGLLDRLATLCAGAPALVRRESWSVHYLNVPPRIAGHIQRCLGL